MLDLDAPQVHINGKLHERVGRYEARYKTRQGPVEVERSLYREVGVRNGPTVDVVSVRAGAVEEGWLPETAQAMAHLMACGTSREAESTAKAPKRPVTRAFRMAYVGTVTLHDKEGEALKTLRYGRMPQGDEKQLAQRMAQDVQQVLSRAAMRAPLPEPRRASQRPSPPGSMALAEPRAASCNSAPILPIGGCTARGAHQLVPEGQLQRVAYHDLPSWGRDECP